MRSYEKVDVHRIHKFRIEIFFNTIKDKVHWYEISGFVIRYQCANKRVALSYSISLYICLVSYENRSSWSRREVYFRYSWISSIYMTYFRHRERLNTLASWFVPVWQVSNVRDPVYVCVMCVLCVCLYFCICVSVVSVWWQTERHKDVFDRTCFYRLGMRDISC